MARRKVVEVEGLQHKHPIPTAVRVGDLVVSSNISGVDRRDGSFPGDVRDEIRNAFDNVAAVLTEAGAWFEDVAKVEVLLRNKGDREVLNDIWLERFPSPADRPVRHTAEQPLPGTMRVQLSILAVLGPHSAPGA